MGRSVAPARRLHRGASILLPVLLLTGLSNVSPSYAANAIVVDTVDDPLDQGTPVPDPLPNNGCEATGGDECTLREALMSAFTSFEDDTITFAGAGIGTISPGQSLPLVPSKTTITGQPGVVIDGANTSGDQPGLVLGGLESTIQGFEIRNFAGDGVSIEGLSFPM